MELLILFKNIFIKEFLIWKRYLFNTISTVITIVLIFVVMFFGLKFIGAKNFGSTIEGLIVGFFVWTYSIMSYSSLSWGILEEARVGTLEQLYMSPYGFVWISLFYVLSNFILSLAYAVPTLFFLMVITGRYLHIDVISILPLLLFTMAGGFGIGYIAAGIGLVSKRIKAFFQILQFIFIGFISVPVSKYPLFKILPFSLGSYLINQNMIKKIPIWRMDSIDLIFLFINGIFYIIIGILIFKLFEKKAKKRGTLGHY